MKKDIVCGMDVKDDSKFTTLHGVKKMFFCSHECQQKFIHAPDAYLKQEEQAQKTKKVA